ncbi:MAG: prephenate dehydrogenase/arogenate dehydrogenase family protein [Candidatus Jordarchaeum sp.]|uniref:prephenate dehydrogenase/arogenate dehydrogenase family protein n=1 Tax=Candidatus Jordarchaeum sp. TaxID=2823881 RepID=UPI00404B9CE7
MKTLRLAIIGGSGSMGKWFAQYFKNKNYSVILSARNCEKLIATAKSLGVNYAEKNEEAVKNADLVLLSTPISSTADIIKQLAPHISQKATVFDIASVKGDIIETLEEQSLKYGFNAVSVHPMFGPGATNIMGRTVIIITVRGSEKAAKRLGRIFKKDGAIVLSVESKKHDRMISTVLGLPHFLNILFGSLLLQIPETIPRIKKFSGTTFTLQLLLTECVFGEDPDLYSEIQMENKEFLKVLEKMEMTFNDLKEIIEKGEKIKFYKNFENVRKKLKQDTMYEKAYDKFYQVLEFLKNNK